MRLSDLLDRKLVTESGDALGHVFDVRVKRDPRSSADRADQKWRIDALIVGRTGVIDRFGVLAIKRFVPEKRSEAVPWNDVVSVEPDRIIVSDR